MNITNIITHRYSDTWPSWDLVYEWEDLIKESFGSKFVDVISPRNKYLRKIYNHISYSRQLFYPWSNSLYFELVADSENLKEKGLNKKNVIPWIIDCYTKTKDDIRKLEYHHSKCKYVLISSKEVYNHLKEAGCNLPLIHLPLALPDKYAITSHTHYQKDYDVILMGRQNPMLLSFLKKYAETHDSFSYLYRKIDGKEFNYYNKLGQYVGNANTRDNYMNLIRRTKVGIYSTPGTDSEKPEAHGFSQVTPRFLEYLSAGTHIIARYIKNDETDFYELEKFCKCINTYDEFEERMNWCLTHEVNMQEYSDYLSKHYMSTRLRKLKSL